MHFTNREFDLIGPTIRFISSAESPKLFQRAVNTQERASAVFNLIRYRVIIALMDAGISYEQVMNDIDPTEIIVRQMLKDGYDISQSTIKLIDMD
jgi:hypothetical protein